MRAWLAFFLAAAPAAAAPPGATLLFPSGGSLSGVLVYEDTATVRLRADGGLVEFPRSALAGVRLGPTAESELEARRAAAGASDPAAHWALALWADENGLPAEAR
ncbi:MAG: hypothetical protein KGL53_05225, partial [Elusimicrobia bacterium]|nr:hypothetical protein [Elusimicrobiota bacterium]